MLGDDEHPISFLFEPRIDGGHVRVTVRTGLRGMRALAGELCFRPAEWVAFREALGRSRPDERLGSTLRESIPTDIFCDPEGVGADSFTTALIYGGRIVHLDTDPIEMPEEPSRG